MCGFLLYWVNFNATKSIHTHFCTILYSSWAANSSDTPPLPCMARPNQHPCSTILQRRASACVFRLHSKIENRFVSDSVAPLCRRSWSRPWLTNASSSKKKKKTESKSSVSNGVQLETFGGSISITTTIHSSFSIIFYHFRERERRLSLFFGLERLPAPIRFASFLAISMPLSSSIMSSTS